MPRISAPTVAENRELRRADLLTAATGLILRGRSFTVAEVAAEVGLSRSAVYEYYSGAGDLVADVLVDELTDWADHLRSATADKAEPATVVDAWVEAVLAMWPTVATPWSGQRARSSCRPRGAQRSAFSTASSSPRCRSHSWR
jgi:AcrR family transcriptional regulator